MEFRTLLKTLARLSGKEVLLMHRPLLSQQPGKGQQLSMFVNEPQTGICTKEWNRTSASISWIHLKNSLIWSQRSITAKIISFDTRDDIHRRNASGYCWHFAGSQRRRRILHPRGSSRRDKSSVERRLVRVESADDESKDRQDRAQRQI